MDRLELLVMHINDALAILHSSGHTLVTASQVAEILWPDGRRKNRNGQVFHLGAARAAAMLRNTNAASELQHRRWEIVPEYLSASSRRAADPLGISKTDQAEQGPQEGAVMRIRVGQLFDIALDGGGVRRGFHCTSVSPGGYADGVAMGYKAEGIPPDSIINIRDRDLKPHGPAAGPAPNAARNDAGPELQGPAERSVDMRIWRLVQLDPNSDVMIVLAPDRDTAIAIAQQWENESNRGLRDWVKGAVCYDVTDRGPIMLLRSSTGA